MIYSLYISLTVTVIALFPITTHVLGSCYYMCELDKILNTIHLLLPFLSALFIQIYAIYQWHKYRHVPDWVIIIIGLIGLLITCFCILVLFNAAADKLAFSYIAGIGTIFIFVGLFIAQPLFIRMLNKE